MIRRTTKRTQRDDGYMRLTAHKDEFERYLTALADTIHLLNDQWWRDPKTGKPITRNKGEMIALIHSELSEALEGVRKDKLDDHLPVWKSETVEMADAVIRIFDYCAGHKLDLAGAIIAKLHFNYRRADHKPENRVKAGGKKF